MFGIANSDEVAYQERSTKKHPFQNTKMCKNSCSNKGFCVNSTCYCQQGSTLDDCSVSKVSDLDKGFKKKNIMMYAAASMGMGILVGKVACKTKIHLK